jgi:hypothetical protein
MANKVTPKISSPGAGKMPNTGGHTDGSIKGGHARGGPLAKPGRSVGMGDSGMRMPVQSPKANIGNQRVGQPDPQTGAAATQKPSKRKTPAPFYGEF